MNLLPLLILSFLTLAPISHAQDYQPTESQTSEPLLAKVKVSAKKIGEILLKECRGIAMAIIPLIVISGLTFLGFRIMLTGTSISEELATFTLVSLIVSTLVFSMWPQKLISSARDGLAAGGLIIGTQIAEAGGGQGESPIEWWTHWIGKPGADDYKFSMKFMDKRIYGGKGDGKMPDKSIETLTAAADELKNSRGAQSPESNAKWLSFAMNIPESLGQILTAAGIISFTFLQLGLTNGMVLGGAELAWHVFIALGLTLIPLTYFKTWSQKWPNYLFYLISIALVPCFFYICAGIGFTMTTGLFDGMFPEDGSGEFQRMFRDMMNMVANPFKPGQTSDALAQFQGLVSPTKDGKETILGFIAQMTNGLFAFSAYWTKYVIGVGIMAAFITAGSAFGLLGVRMAFSWSDHFADAAKGMIDQTNESFSKITNAMASGMGSLGGKMGQTAQQVGGAGAGFLSKILGGRKK